jgi:glutamate-1-semialdehyde 2,1-aminomutase
MGVPSSPGVPDAISDLTIVLPYNDLAAVEQTLKSQGDQIAAVIVEPVAANMGVVPPAQGYLEGLRQLTAQVGALLIFDEVITGFRLSLGGAQSFYGVTPDLTCLGKIIGGGLPVGAYGGKTEIMEMVAPEGSVYQAGTLSGNPLAVQAGITTLERLQQPGIYRELETRGRRLAEGLRQAAKNAGLQATVNQVGSLLSILFTAGPVNGLDAALESDLEQFRNYFQMMLEEGIYLAPSQFEALFVSLAHTDEDIERTISAAGRVLKHLPSKLACESSIRRQL